MKTLLIVYHSQSGAAASLARALWRGAQRETGVCSQVRRACDAGIDCLADADGLALVAAENSGSAAGGMKEWLDRVFYPAIDRGLLLPYALVISAGNDGRGAQRQLERILSGIPLRQAMATRIVRGEPGADDLAACTELGEGLAAGLDMGIY